MCTMGMRVSRRTRVTAITTFAWKEQHMVAPSTWKHEGFAYAVLSALPALIVVIDCQGAIVAANSEWCEAACAAGSPDLVETTIGRNYLNICSEGTAAGA